MASSSDGQDVDPKSRVRSNIKQTEEQPWRQELREIMSSEHLRCHVCCGFYGSNHSQPICSTCHLYLFPPIDLDKDEFLYNHHFYSSFPQREPQGSVKDDSEDSGTEDPQELELECSRAAPIARLLYTGVADPTPNQLKQRVKNLSEYSRDNDPRVLGDLVQNFPPEVLLVVFRYLDDISLQMASSVCTKWADIIESEVTDEEWEQHVKSRWPLFKPYFRVDSWKEIHSQLTNSAPCIYCLDSMAKNRTPPIKEDSWRHRRLANELRQLNCDPPEGIYASPLDDKCSHWQAIITGPKGSPYEDGIFYLYLKIPSSYPLSPPLIQFMTKILHPNVSRHGNIGLDSIHHNWSLALTISKILLSIQSLLTDPYLHVCMEPTIAKCYKEDRRMFNQAARMWTWKYAMTEKKQVYFGPIDNKDGFVALSSSSL